MSAVPTVEFVVQPVISERLWSDALVPRNGGGWIWMGCFYNYPHPTPVEWAVVPLETGDSPSLCPEGFYHHGIGAYTNSNFRRANQLRAPDGGVFFPAEQTKWYHYSPTTEKITTFDRIDLKEQLWYSASFSVDGSRLYGGTLGVATSAQPRHPKVFWIDTATLEVTMLGFVTGAARTQNAYAYYVRGDGDWLYVLVGEEFWELFAVRISTGAVTLLATANVHANATFTEKCGGLVVNLYSHYGASNETVVQYWCLDGAIVWYTSPDEYPPTQYVSRTVKPYSNPVVGAPQIDNTLGVGHLKWLANGSTGPWTQIDYATQHAAAVNLESLLMLPNGDLVGNAAEYQGWFRYARATDAITYYGPFAGVSTGPRINLDGYVYFTGYPNAPLWRWDPSQPFSRPTNPCKLGNYSNSFTKSGVKRGHILAYSAVANRIYMCGSRQRSGTGAGVGYYDLTTRVFDGTFCNLNYHKSLYGMVVFDNLSRVVFSGHIGDDPNSPGTTPTVAQIVLYDFDCCEKERQTPIPLLLDTGILYRTNEPTVIVGLSPSGKVLYRWDIVNRTLLKSVSLSAFTTIGSSIQLANGRYGILAVFDTQLFLIDSFTLNFEAVADLSAIIAQYGDPVFASDTGGGSDSDAFSTLYVTLYFIARTRLIKIRVKVPVHEAVSVDGEELEF